MINLPMLKILSAVVQDLVFALRGGKDEGEARGSTGSAYHLNAPRGRGIF